MSIEMRPKVRNNEILIQELEKELLIYDLKINKAFSLNETCAMVWRECDGKKSIAEIAATLSQRTKNLVNEDFVLLALIELEKDNLLEKTDRLCNQLKGLSRREIVKRVGFSSMVALPVIASLLAPTAAIAASGAVCRTGVPGTNLPAGAIFSVQSPSFPTVCSIPFCQSVCSLEAGVSPTNLGFCTCASQSANYLSCAAFPAAPIACNCKCN